MTQQLTPEQIVQISNRFNVHYKTIEESPHFDEFMVLDTDKPNDVPFCIHQKSICCDFTALLQTDQFRSLDTNRVLSAAGAELRQMPVILPPRNESQVASVLIDEEGIKTLIIVGITDNNYQELQKLLLKVDGEFVFQKLGNEFFSRYKNNQVAKNLFTRLRSSISDAQTSALFNTVVLQHKSQLLLTPEKAQSLYVAVQDRTQVPVDKVLQYSTPEDLNYILQQLADLGATNRYSNGFDAIKDFEVTRGTNGNLIVDAPEQTVEVLERIIETNKRSFHLAMSMSSSLYKQVQANYGENSNEYRYMNGLNNNVPGDPTPYKLLEALRLLGISIPQSDIRYNNTKNTLDYKTNENQHNGRPKKGGSGFIIDNISAANVRLIQAITCDQLNRFSIPLSIESVLHNQINQLQAKAVLRRYPTRREQLEVALILLDIKFRRIDFDATNNQFVVVTDLKEQAKIKKINHMFSVEGSQAIPFNKEDIEYTRNYTPHIITPTAEQGTLVELVEAIKAGTASAEVLTTERSVQDSVAEQGYEILTLTPDMARSIYVAVQDRKQLPVRPVDRVLKYLDPHSMALLLDDLRDLSIAGNSHSREFSVLNNCAITSAANGCLKVRAPTAAIRQIRQVTDFYKNSIHLAIVMSSGLYKEVEDKFGSESTEFQAMQKLDNNTLGDPTPYKLLEALRLLDIKVSNVRYNNTLNELEYKNQDNKDNNVDKKGGSGFILEVLDQNSLRLIEEIAERQAYRMVLDEFFEFALYDLINRSNNDDAKNILERCGDDRRSKVETALMLLGIECRQVLFNQRDNRFIIQVNQIEQSKIKKILISAFPGNEIGKSVLIFNREDEGRTATYTPGVIRELNLAQHLEQVRNERQNLAPFPVVLPYRHALNENQNITEIKELLSQIRTAIASKTNGRAVWFERNTTLKCTMLDAVDLWLEQKRFEDANNLNIEVILGLIRDICAIKRNAFGLFAPHSLQEFNEKFAPLMQRNGVSLKSRDYYSVSQLELLTDETSLNQVDTLIERVVAPL